MGNAQTSICFRVAWKDGEDPNEVKLIPKKLWPIPVIDIDLIPGIIGDYIKGFKAAIIVNVASN